MRTRLRVYSAGLAVLVLAGCSGPTPEPGPARSTVPPPLPARAVVEPIDPERLQQFLPVVSGWERGAPTAQRMTSPILFTEASALYRRGGATIDLKIIDSGGNPRLFAPFTGLMGSGFRADSANGFERSATIRNAPGWEKWDSGTRNGELGVAVNRRFLVQLEGHNVETIEALHTLVDATDLDGLASLP